MKTSLSHLPDNKRQQLEEIVNITRSVIDPEKIILFGSYAKGTWVEDRYQKKHITYEYISDYDLLVVLKSGEKMQDHVVQDMIENRWHFKAPVNVLVHDIDYVNKALSEGRYFFSDIYKEGIILYDAKNVNLKKPRILSSREIKNIAKQDFDKWYTSAKEFLIDAQNAFDRKSLKNGIFHLHQATERFYNAVILVFTGYKIKTHNLHKLRRSTKSFSIEMFSLFPYPINDEREMHLFDLLKKGYIEARYDDDYSISEEELKILMKRIIKMKTIVKLICMEKINSF